MKSKWLLASDWGRLLLSSIKVTKTFSDGNDSEVDVMLTLGVGFIGFRRFA